VVEQHTIIYPSAADPSAGWVLAFQLARVRRFERLLVDPRRHEHRPVDLPARMHPRHDIAAADCGLGTIITGLAALPAARRARDR
jgi:hypothetical protein